MPEKATVETETSVATRARAQKIAAAGGLAAARASGALPRTVETTLSEAVVLGLLKQGVTTWFAILGHGSTDLGEVLRIYGEEGLVRTVNCRNEVEMAHAATALSWQYGEVPAVVTSIGPGALQAMAGSLAAASNGVGVWHVYGDETTFGEGYNMQQIPKEEQGLFGRLTATMGASYVLHTPEAVRDALRRGGLTVHHPYRARPFYLLLPINVQPARLSLNVDALPQRPDLPALAPATDAHLSRAADRVRAHRRIAIKAGGGTRGHDAALRRLAEGAGGVVVASPGSTGILPDGHPQYMHVGGSKGSISGNHAMENATLLIAVGSRGVCQADCSGIGYPAVTDVININGDLADVGHYNRTVALAGDVDAVIDRLLAVLEETGGAALDEKADWLAACAAKKSEWAAFKAERYAAPPLHDAAFGRPLLTQPVAIKTVADFAKTVGAAKFFDAGDVQANGFQIVEDERTGDTFTEAGASYMGFAVSALLAGAAARAPRYGIAFTGDGSFAMNPQILIDAVEHGAMGMIALFDNRRMSAIIGLQIAQYGHGFAEHDRVPVDYAALAGAVAGVKGVFGGFTRESLGAALEEAFDHDGLSLVHVPVYFGEDPLGGMGAFGAWNVGNWCADVQARWLSTDI